MNQSAPRVAALVAAPLVVVAATALVLLPRGGARPPAPSPDGPTVIILHPEDRAVLDLGLIPVGAELSDPEGITIAELRIDDDKIASQITSGGSAATVNFDWTPRDAGDYTLLVRARDTEGNWGEAAVTVSVGTGKPPLPPPPTTALATTVPITTAATTTLEPTTLPPATTAAVPTTRPPAPPTRPTPPPTPPPTAPPTLPPTAPPTLPPTTLPPTTLPPTTTTVAPTTTTTSTTVPPTVAGPGPGPGPAPRCRLDPATLLLPLRAGGQSLQPLFAWSYLGSCPPSSQILRIRAGRGLSYDIPLSGSVRSYQLGFALPACTGIRWDIVTIDAGGQARGSRSGMFGTAC